MKKALLVIVLLVFLFIPIFANTTTTADYRTGQLASLTNPNSLVFDSSFLSIVEVFPDHYAYYLGGYPAENSSVSQLQIQIEWIPTKQVFLAWFIY